MMSEKDTTDELPQTLKDALSQLQLSPDVQAWVERMRPSRQRGMTPLQRQRQARVLRQLRRERYAETQGG